MKKELVLKLLSELDKHGVTSYYNVSNFMCTHFKQPHFYDDEEQPHDTTIDVGSQFLTELESRGYIKFEVPISYKINHANVSENLAIKNSIGNWFHNTAFFIKITIGGLEFLNNSYLAKSTRKLNRYNSITVWVQSFFSFVAIIIAGVSSKIAYDSEKQNKTNTVAIEKLSKELTILKSEQQKLKTETERLRK
jgi:hypothetical protein